MGISVARRLVSMIGSLRKRTKVTEIGFLFSGSRPRPQDAGKVNSMNLRTRFHLEPGLYRVIPPLAHAGFPYRINRMTSATTAMAICSKALGPAAWSSYYHMSGQFPYAAVDTSNFLTASDKDIAKNLEIFLETWSSSERSWGAYAEKVRSAFLPAGCFLVSLGETQVIGEQYVANRVMITDSVIGWAIVDIGAWPRPAFFRV